MESNKLGGLIDCPFHIAGYGRVHSLVLIKEGVQDLIIVVLNGASGFLNASFITFLPVKINIIMGDKVVEVPGK
jgi:hypothetical protein